MKRLTRVLVYEGSDIWIESCIAMRQIKGHEPLEWLYEGKTIVETTMTVETLPDDNAKPKKDPK